jgi:hypothetical protein
MFPITPVGGIVVMIVIFVVYGQLMQVGEVELSPATATDPWMNVKGLGTVTTFTRLA